MQPVFLFGAIRPLSYFYAVTATLGVLFTFVSPDSHRSGIGDLVFWLAQTLIPLSCILALHLLLCRLPLINQLGNLLKLSLSALCGVLVYLPIALWLDARFDQQPLPPEPGDILLAVIDELGAVGPPVWIGWLALNAPWLLGYRFEQAGNNKLSAGTTEITNNESVADSPSAVTLPFMPADLNEIIYLKAELHYLMVVTTRGQSLELCNLRDAVSALDAVDGISPHRSWWVNSRYIERYIPSGRQAKLLLTTGDEVPVSRRKMAAVKASMYS